MQNPFDSLASSPKKDKKDDQYSISGIFPCYTEDCERENSLAWYSPSKQELRWTCIEGHESAEKDFVLE